MAMKCSGQSMVGMEQKNYKRRISQYLDLTLPCWMRILSWCYVQNETFGYSGLCLQFHEFDLHECPEEEEEGEGGRERERARASARARAREGGREKNIKRLPMHVTFRFGVGLLTVHWGVETYLENACSQASLNQRGSCRIHYEHDLSTPHPIEGLPRPPWPSDMTNRYHPASVGCQDSTVWCIPAESSKE